MKNMLFTLACLAFPGGAIAQNLIANGQFQYPSMEPRCDGWFNSCREELTWHCDTTLYCFTGLAMDSPSLIPEDLWCLSVKAGFPNEGYAETYITGLEGTIGYELNYWLKAHEWPGIASVGKGAHQQFETLATRMDETGSWAQLSLSGTVEMQPSDTLTVRLGAGLGDFCICPPVHFAFVELTAGPLTSVQELNVPASSIRAWPNPANDRVTIQVASGHYEGLILEVFNAVGQRLVRKETKGDTFTLHKDECGSGLLFYEVRGVRDGESVGRGRVVMD